MVVLHQLGALVALFAAGALAQPAGTSYSLNMKTLVLHSGDALRTLVPKMVLNGYGTPYDVMSALPDLSKPSYSSIVIADRSVASADMAKVREYAAKYNVRIVVLDSVPSADLGVVASAASLAPKCVFDDSAYARDIADIMTMKGSWPCDSAELQTPTPVEVANTTAVRPFMRFVAAGPGPSATGPVAAYTVRTPYGTEEMHFAFNVAGHELTIDANGIIDPLTIMDNDPAVTELHIALVNVWFQWVTRGVYLGQRRSFLQLHVDDWFAASDVYGSAGKSFRLRGSDVQYVVNWIDTIGQKLSLPAGSNVTLEPAFNGAGHSALNLPDDGLREATNTYLDKFNWISHTWTHQNLDWSTAADCAGLVDTCHPTRERILAECQYNTKLAEGIPIAQAEYLPELNGQPTPGGQMFGMHPEAKALHWSRSCMVTPEISGLWPASLPTAGVTQNGHPPYPKNTVSLQALYDSGIRTVVGDNSRDELMSKVSSHWGIFTTVEEYGVDGMLIIPRWAPSADYNVIDDLTMAANYQAFNSCTWSYYGSPCLDRPYTFTDILDRDAGAATIPLLTFRADPYMFHQGNLAVFTSNGTQQTITTAWAEVALRRIMTYVDKQPIISPKMEFTADFFRERMIRDQCGLVGYEDFDAKGNLLGVRLQSTGTCTAVVSVSKPATSASAKHKLGGADGTENYGLDVTYRVSSTPQAARTLTVAAASPPDPSSTSSASSTSEPTVGPNPNGGAATAPLPFVAMAVLAVTAASQLFF